MKMRALKIAMSTASVLACVLVVALWVRSYRNGDSLIWNGWVRVAVYSRYGQIRVLTSTITFIGSPLLQWQTGLMMPDNIGPWYFRLNRQSMFVVFPHRLPIVLLVFLAVAPWIRWRFSLRALLIAMTVIAVALGLIAWLR